MAGSTVVDERHSDNKTPADELPVSWPCCLPFLILGYAVHTQTNFCPYQLKGMSELLIAAGLGLFVWLVVRGFFKQSKLRLIDIIGFNSILLLTISNAICSTVVLYTIQQGDTQCTTLNSWERPLAALSFGLNFSVFEAMLWLITTGFVRGILDWYELRNWAVHKSHNTAAYPWVLTAIVFTAIGWAGSDQSLLAIVKGNSIPASAISDELESALIRRREDREVRRLYQTGGTWLDLSSADFTITVTSGASTGLVDADAGLYSLGSSETFSEDTNITISWGDKFFSIAAIRIGITATDFPDLEKAVVQHDGIPWSPMSITNTLKAPGSGTDDDVGEGYCTAGSTDPFGWYGRINFTGGEALCREACENDPVCAGFTEHTTPTGTCYVYCMQEYNVSALACTNEGDTSSLTMSSDTSDSTVDCRKMGQRAWSMIYHNDPNNEETYSNMTISLPLSDGWGSMTIGEMGILGKETTFMPTWSPTPVPSFSPTETPTNIPTPTPTTLPTPSPSTTPTLAPTSVPTYKTFQHTDTVWVECSNNVEMVECYTCYDDHSSIFMNFESSNAELTVEGDDCPATPYDADGNIRNDWIDCEGNWTVRAAASMYMDPTYQGESAFVMWDVWEIGEQTLPYDNQSDGRLDVDQTTNSTDWRRYYHFIDRMCAMDTDGGTEDCYLPKQVQKQDNVIACTWKMPKKSGDGRTKPIIWSFGDSLATWHSWRPELNYEYKVMNFSELEEGLDFTPGNLIANFLSYIIVAVVVFVNFMLITCFACTLDQKVESEYDYSLDTRTYKTIYDTSVQTKYYYNVKRIEEENKFICYKHGPYILIVLFTGIVRAIMFTFIFCSILFHALNEKHFENLSDNYPIFADERDTQLLNMHYTIEEFYDTEVARMEHEYDLITKDCYGDRIVEMQDGYDDEKLRIKTLNDDATSYENIKSEYATGNDTNKTWAFLGYHPCIIPESVVSYEDSITYTKVVEDTGNAGDCISSGEEDPQTRADCELYFCYWAPASATDPNNVGSCVNALTEQWSIDKFDETIVLEKVELECRTAYWCMGYSYQRVNVTSWLDNNGSIYECKDEDGSFVETIDVDSTTYYSYHLSADYDGYCNTARTNLTEDYSLFLENYDAGGCYYCVTSNQGLTALVEVMDEPNYYLFEGNLEAVEMYGLESTYTNPTYSGFCYEHEEGFSWPANLETVAEETEYAYEDVYVTMVETEIKNFNDFWNALTTQSEGESCREADGWVEWEEMQMCVLMDDTILGGTGGYTWSDANSICNDESILSVFSAGGYPDLISAANLAQLDQVRDYCYTAFSEPSSDSWCFLQWPMFGDVWTPEELRAYFNWSTNSSNWEGNDESYISFDDASLGQGAWSEAVVKATAPDTNIVFSFIRKNRNLYNDQDPVRAMCLNGYEDTLISINTDPDNPYSVSLNTAGYILNEGFFADIGVFCPNCPDSWSTPTLENVDTSTWSGNDTDYDNSINNGTIFDVADAVDGALITPDENFTVTINTDLFDMPLNFNGLTIDVPVVVNLFLGFDALMMIYRITIIAVMVTDLIIGRDKEVSTKYLAHGKSSVSSQAREASDKLCWGLGACLRGYRNIGGTIWYLIPYIFKLCMLATTAAAILILYVVMDQVITIDVLSGFGAFEAMTMGIAIHRAVRNEQIAVRALYINSVNIPTIESSLQTYADSLILQTYSFNVDELDDTNSFNARFCPLLRTYLYTPRDLSYFLFQVYIVGGNDEGTNGYENVATQGLAWGTLCTEDCTSLDTSLYPGGDQSYLTYGLTDGNSQTYWQPALGTYDESGALTNSPTNTYTEMIIELSAQTELGDLEDGSRNGISFFEVTQIVFTWGLKEVDSSPTYRSEFGIPSYTLTPAAEGGGTAIWYALAGVNTACDQLTDSVWTEAEYEVTSTHDSSSLSTTIDTAFPYEHSAEISTSEAKCVKISWNTADWGGNVQVGSTFLMSSFFLQEVNLYGRLPLEKAANCPRALWTEMFYQPSEFNESCDIFTPVHGFSMNEFVRDVWSDKLEAEHEPYMNAIRSILLSPFFIVLTLVIALIIFIMVGGMIEMILLRSGLIRENPYAKIRCVLTHETYEPRPKRTLSNLFCVCPCCCPEDKKENEGHPSVELNPKKRRSREAETQHNIYAQDTWHNDREKSAQKKKSAGLPAKDRLVAEYRMEATEFNNGKHTP